MTREAMLQEINQFPDDVLEAFLNLMKLSNMAKLEVATNEVTTKQYRAAGALKGKIILHDDFDEPLEDMKEYM